MAQMPMEYEVIEDTTFSSSNIYHTSGSTGKGYLKKRGKTCQMMINGFSSLNTGTNDLGVLIPEGFRPPMDQTFTFINGSTTYYAIRVSMYANGKIGVHVYGTQSEGVLNNYTVNVTYAL